MIIRWICEKCNKKWIYPIDKCIYCKGKIKEQVSRKAKVIGITKVMIPSPLHPIAPYNILILEDKDGNRIPKKTMKDYEIGDVYDEKPAKNKHAVSIVKIKYDVKQAVKDALYLINDLDVNKNSKVLIKLNIMSAMQPYLAATTNPKALDAVISNLLDKNVKRENITVAEQCIYAPMEEALEKTGLGNIIKKYNVKFVDIAKTEFKKEKIMGMEIGITKELFEKDLIINLPVLKTHLLFSISGAFENMSRVVDGKTLKSMQEMKIDLNKAIAELHTKLPKYVTIGDGIIGMHGNGPLSGEPAFLNYILASKDPVAHDAVFQELGLLMTNAKYLEIAKELDLGENNLENIEIVGNELKATARELKPAIGSKLLKL